MNNNTYTVVLTRTLRYEIIVEAASEYEANARAWAKVRAGYEPDAIYEERERTELWKETE